MSAKSKNQIENGLTVERLLDVLGLRDDESGLSLRILHVRKFIKVCLPLEEELHSLRVAVVARIVERGPLSNVNSQNASSASQDEFKALLAAFAAGVVKSGALLLILGIQIGPTLQKCLHDFKVVVQACQMQWSLELVGDGVQIGSVPDQSVD